MGTRGTSRFGDPLGMPARRMHETELASSLPFEEKRLAGALTDTQPAAVDLLRRPATEQPQQSICFVCPLAGRSPTNAVFF